LHTLILKGLVLTVWVRNSLSLYRWSQRSHWAIAFLPDANLLGMLTCNRTCYVGQNALMICLGLQKKLGPIVSHSRLATS